MYVCMPMHEPSCTFRCIGIYVYVYILLKVLKSSMRGLSLCVKLLIVYDIKYDESTIAIIYTIILFM